jgi:deoxyribodipyrimidine photo-lyase
VEQGLKKALDHVNVPLVLPWGSTLHHLDDLGFSVTDMPDTFTAFRRRVENRVDVRKSVVFSALKPFPSLFSFHQQLPQWFRETESGKPMVDEVRNQPDKRGIWLRGGESHALDRLRHYVSSDLVVSYKETRNGTIGLDYSTKFSSYLALGCLSVRQVFAVLAEHQSKRGHGAGPTFGNVQGWEEGPYWLYFELLWRDCFKFMGLKYGDKLFYLKGIRGERKSWAADALRLQMWVDGQTGIPWVDAAMRELKFTGYMSNRLRQNVASFLVHSLGMDWRLGAAYFESTLVDYDTQSNYGNWQYVAGVGSDPRGKLAVT